MFMKTNNNMKNVKEALKQAIKLRELATDRAKDLFMARGGYKSHCIGIEFEENKIAVRLEESTIHDCPDRDWISLGISQLEMTENEWADYLLKAKTEYLADEQKIKEKAEQAKLEAKQKEFDRLKNELGL